MSTTVYVITKARSSPVAIGYEVPHEVCLSRESALKRVKELNSKSRQCVYDCYKVPTHIPSTKETA